MIFPIQRAPSLLLLLAILFVIDGCRRPGEGATPAPSEQSTRVDDASKSVPVCPIEADPVVFQAEENTNRLHATPASDWGEAAVAWEGDLNRDGLNDYILVYPDHCGNWGECPFGVYVRCTSADSFVAVWGPDYAFDLRVADEAASWNQRYRLDLPAMTRDTTGRDSTWSSLIQILRIGDAQDDRLSPQVLRFGAQGYAPPSTADR